MCEMHVMVLESPLLIFCPLQSAPVYCKKMGEANSTVRAVSVN